MHSEPVQFKAPTFSSDSSSYTFKKHQNSSFALLCQAQAWPVEPIGSVAPRFSNEPVGSVPPKLSSGDKTRTVESKINGSITMLCPMQSLPVSIFSILLLPPHMMDFNVLHWSIFCVSEATTYQMTLKLYEKTKSHVHHSFQYI
uniref:CSON015506 protein n=1 Tax=Culicoides sonorensis TaxID=179676 RepID=A0A336LS87_CULSO